LANSSAVLNSWPAPDRDAVTIPAAAQQLKQRGTLQWNSCGKELTRTVFMHKYYVIVREKK